MNEYTIKQSRFAYFFTTSNASAPLWLIVRLYLGYTWVLAGYEKLLNPAWFGSGAGAALQGFVQNALTQTGGPHPAVQMWYATFLQNAVFPHLTLWSNAVTLGELAIGLGLIVGLFTGVAAFFGGFMNLNFLLAGAVSTNPIMLVLAIGIVLARRVAGYWGLDRFAKPYFNRMCRSSRKSA